MGEGESNIFYNIFFTLVVSCLLQVIGLWQMILDPGSFEQHTELSEMMWRGTIDIEQPYLPLDLEGVD